MLIDANLMVQVFLVGQPVEEQLDQTQDVLVTEQSDSLQLHLFSVARNVLQHELVRQGDQCAHVFHLYA